MRTPKIVSKEAFNAFIEHLAEKTPVVAPVEREGGSFSFEEVRDASSLEADYIPTLSSPKKYFFPPEEVLLRFQASPGERVDAGGDVETAPEV